MTIDDDVILSVALEWNFPACPLRSTRVRSKAIIFALLQSSSVTANRSTLLGLPETHSTSAAGFCVLTNTNTQTKRDGRDRAVQERKPGGLRAVDPSVLVHLCEATLSCALRGALG